MRPTTFPPTRFIMGRKPAPFRMRRIRFAGIIGILAFVSLFASAVLGQKTHPNTATVRASETKATDQQVEDKITAIIDKMTLEQKIDMIGGVDGFYIRPFPNLGLPRLKMSDGPLGARNDGPATTMAGGIGLAATWDTGLAKQEGTQIGRDARARGVHFMLGPGVNIHVAPMNGRNFEYLGEDPFLASRIAVNYIEGMQSQGVSATIKHFMGNNSEYDRHKVDSIIDERTMREIYLPVFESAVREAHVGAIMDSYNLVNGEHSTQNKYLNTDIVKKDWGFKGLIMSDWFATYDGVAAANSGMDLEMPSGAFMNRATLLPAIKEGKVSVATIDYKIRRILRTEMRFGWLDRDQKDLSIPLYNVPGNETALQVAREGIVLLKNDGGLLPLDKSKTKSIAVIGPDAYPAVPDGGGSAHVQPFSAVSFLKGISDAMGPNANVYYNRGIADWKQLANETVFHTAADGGKQGVTVETFNNPDFSGTPESTKTLRHINETPRFTFADLANMDPADAAAFFASQRGAANGSSTRWTGYYTAKEAGKYEVLAQSPGENGGFRLYLDDKLVLDDWKIRKAMIDNTVIELSAGPHKVVFEKFLPRGTRDVFGGTARVGIAPQDSVVDPIAKKLAAEADVVVVAAGFDPDSESEGGDRTFGLPFGQDELIREMAAANRNTIVVVTSGGAVDASGWLDRVPAFIEAWYPGQEGGTALADILLGSVNPSGHLPISYDKSWQDSPAHDSYYPEPGTNRVVYKDGIFVGYRGYDHNGVKPLFPFGYGLSYTTFKYSKLAVTSVNGGSAGPEAPLYEVSFDVTNTGKRAGAAVAQMYISDKHAKVPRPPKELKGFAKVNVEPGQTQHVVIPLNVRSLAYYDVQGKEWRADPGEFDVLVGDSSENIELTGKLTLDRALTAK